MNRRSSSRPNEGPLPDPLAYFLTWTTYGTWLPGDRRGWVSRDEGLQLPKPSRKLTALTRMAEEPCTLNDAQRAIVEMTIAEHCRIRGWELFAVNCRTNHVHVVVAADRAPDEVMDQFKAWCTRRLKEQSDPSQGPVRQRWWTENGSKRYLNDATSLEDAVRYVREFQ